MHTKCSLIHKVHMDVVLMLGAWRVSVCTCRSPESARAAASFITAMPRSDEHAPLLETARVSSRGSRLDNRLALWGDSSNVKRAGFIVTLAVLGLVALVVVRCSYRLQSSSSAFLGPFSCYPRVRVPVTHHPFQPPNPIAPRAERRT